MDFKRYSAVLAWIILTAFPAMAQPLEPPPDIPCSIGGTLTINGTQLIRPHDGGLVIIATREDMSSFTPAAKDDNGLGNLDWYNVKVPLYEPDGVEPGERIILHVYLNGSKLLVTSPAGGYIVIDPPESHQLEVHLEAISGPKTGEKIYSEAQLQETVAEAENKVREKFDIYMDDRVGLPEAIHALRVIAGVPQ
jgi:hypothetical protein